MSTILRALRRVENAHDGEHSKSALRAKPALEGDWLGEGTAEPPPEPSGRGAQSPRSVLAVWPWMLAGFAGLGLIGSGVWLWIERAAEPMPVAQEPVVVATAPVLPREAVPAARAPLPEPDPPAPDMTLVQQRLREAAEARRAEAAPAVAPITRESPPPVPPTPAAAAPEPEPVLAHVAPEPAPPRSKPAPRPPDARTPAPLVEVIPAPPEIRVERTRWHPTAQKRTARVWVAGVVHDVRETDQIDGLRVSEIRPSTVVFIHQGIRIERKPGS